MPEVPKLVKLEKWERQWLDNVIKDGQTTYEETFQLMHHLRRIRALRVKGRTPRSFSKIMGSGVRAPMSWAHTQTIVGMIAKNRPHFSRMPENDKDKERAQRLANTAMPTLESLERAAHRPLYYLFADQLAGDGRGVMKLRIVPWEGYPIPQEDENKRAYNKRVDEWRSRSTTQPFRLGLVDPMHFMPARDEWDIPYVTEVSKRPTKSVLNRLNLSLGVNNTLRTMDELPKGRAYNWRELPRGVGATMEVAETWTDDGELFIRMGGEHYFKMENAMGFIPYTWRFGEQTSIPDPALEGVSSIFPFIGIEPWLNTMLSVMAAWAVLGSTPILWTSRETNSAVPTARAPIGDIPLGKKIDLGPGGKIGFVEPPGVGREVKEYIELLFSIYERAGITPLARGLVGTRTPGLTLSAALEAASDRLKPMVFSLEDGMAEIMSKIWRIVDTVIKAPVSVTGDYVEEGMFKVGKGQVKKARFVIDPKDIHGYYDCNVEVKMSNLQDVTNQGMHAAFMVGHKLWSKERGMRFSSVDDPFEEYLQITREEFRDDPRLKELLFNAAVSEDPTLSQEMQELIQAGQEGIDEAAALSGGGGGGGGEDRFEGEPPREGGFGGGRPAGAARRPTGPRGSPPEGNRFKDGKAQ